MSPIESGLRALLLGLLRTDPEVRAELAAIVAEAGAPQVDALLTVAEAAAAARCSAATIRRAIKAGKLAATGSGKMLRVARRDLDAWLDRARAASRPTRGTR